MALWESIKNSFIAGFFDFLLKFGVFTTFVYFCKKGIILICRFFKEKEILNEIIYCIKEIPDPKNGISDFYYKLECSKRLFNEYLGKDFLWPHKRQDRRRLEQLVLDLEYYNKVDRSESLENTFLTIKEFKLQGLFWFCIQQ